MVTKLQRPGMKVANVKVTDADMVYFSLGLGTAEYILPTERDDYRSDARAVALVKDVRAGKDVSGRNFSGINLKNADLSGGHFAGCNFSGAVFYRTNAKNADFTQANFTEAYLEGVDFTNADLTDADFKRVYARALILDNARVNPADQKRFDALEVLIEKIESGEIDIRFLSRADLLGLDLRRLDLTHVDLDGVDLSSFVLEGVNLRGVYIDPKQLMSLEGLMHYYAEIRTMKAKALQAEALRIVKENDDKHRAYARMKADERAADQVIYSNTAVLKRPAVKPILSPEAEVQPQKRPPATLQQAMEIELVENKKRLAQEKIDELRGRLAERTFADTDRKGKEKETAVVSPEQGLDTPKHTDQQQNLQKTVVNDLPVETEKHSSERISTQLTDERPVQPLVQETPVQHPMETQDTVIQSDKNTKIGQLVEHPPVEQGEQPEKISLDEIRAGFSADPVMYEATDSAQTSPSKNPPKKTSDSSDSEEGEGDDVREIKDRPTVKDQKEVFKQSPTTLQKTVETSVKSDPLIDTTKQVAQSEPLTGIHQMAQKPRKITSQAYETVDEEKEQNIESVTAHKNARVGLEVGRDAHKKNRT